ncbi:MAG: OmpA family protein [Lewinellaceae bacterium]|nr:OmpA family protein [Lewinellaceae bacterium]
MRSLLWFLLFTVYALGARWYFVCQVRGLCQDKDIPAIVEQPDIRLKNLRFTAGDSVLLADYDHFAFDSAAVRPRLNANNEQFLDSVAAYLQRNPEQNLTITGLYRPSEATISSTYFENLGLARAAEIRIELLRRGIKEERVTLNHQLNNNEALFKPAAFDAYSTTDKGDFTKESFSFTNMTFSDANFAFDSDEFRPGEAFIRYADSVKTYLELYPEMKMAIIGHTDNKGSSRYNKDLGMRRARSAREYFRELGVSTTRIAVDSRGEKEPVATNNTDEGRQRNRRVNFVLK